MLELRAGCGTIAALQDIDPMSNHRPYHKTACPACTHHVAVDFFGGGTQPLATLGWPASAEEAMGMARLPLDFVRCVDCGHVFNTAFDYQQVPYSRKPNLMFNAGKIWAGFLADVQHKLLARLPERPVIVEIGYGDGGFISALAKLAPGGRFVGFDPHGAEVDGGPVETRKEMFDPALHLAELKPDLLISRHVLEHLHNPLGFLQEISFSATLERRAPLAYFEVPCIDNAMESQRTVDFYYEHSSQFTTSSFSKMLERAGVEVLEMDHGYDGEVVFGLVRIGDIAHHQEYAKLAGEFSAAANLAVDTIASQLAALHDSGQRIAVWGGTGKSAAFMCRYGMDAARFPLVVDSDPQKTDTFVPGTGQRIHFRDYLLDDPVDVLVIPPQWRAADILAEMKACGISVKQILIEHRGRLVDFLEDKHIYAVDGQ